jgi:hypothetical protein
MESLETLIAAPAMPLRARARLLSDGIPLRLETRIVLRIPGDPREEMLPSVLPSYRFRRAKCCHLAIFLRGTGLRWKRLEGVKCWAVGDSDCSGGFNPPKT